MTSKELANFREYVRQEIEIFEECERQTIIYKFPEELLVAASEPNARVGPPFAVVGSSTMDPSVGRVWPIRKYPWYVNLNTRNKPLACVI